MFHFVYESKDQIEQFSNMSKIMFWQEITLNVVAMIVIAGCVYHCFENGIPNEFTFDDHLAIEGNGDVDINNQPFKHLWFSDIWGKDLLAHDSHRSYRPLLIVIFRYLYSFTHEAPLFRLVSIFAHLTVSIFVFSWTKTILSRESWAATDSFLVAWGTSLLFATHPIHVEAVTAVVNLAEPLSALFIIIGYLIFHRTMSTNIQTKSGWCILLIIFWWLNGIIATLLKETGILIALLPLVYILGQWTVKMISNPFLRSGDAQKGDLTMYFSSMWIGNCSLFLYLYFASRSLLVNPQREIILQSPIKTIRFVAFFLFEENAGDSYLNASQLLRRAENPFAFITPVQKRVMSMLYLYFRYFYVMLWPEVQSPEYSFNCIPAIEDWKDNRFIASVATITLIFLVGVYSCTRLLTKHNAEKQNSALFEGMLWLIIPFLPLTGIVFTLGTLLAERLLYLCSVGFCFLVAYLGYSILVFSFSESFLLKSSKLVGNIRRVMFATIIVIVVYAYATHTRFYNTVWRNDATLFLHAVKVCPESAKSNLQVSKLYSNQGYMKPAKYHLEQAKRIDPDFCDVHLQEAYILLGKDLGNPPEDMAVTHQAKRNADMRDSEALTIDIAAPDIMDRIQDAALALLRSIGCVFTNHQALRLLQQLWEVQLMATQSYPQILASSGSTTQPQTVSKEQLHMLQAKFRAQMLRKQALQASRIQMDYVAVTKYVEAANLYFDYTPTASEQKQGKNKRYYEQKALFILSKAQGIIDKFFRSASTDSAQDLLSGEAMTVMHAAQCRISLLAGGMRSTWMEHFRPTHALSNNVNDNSNTNDKSAKKKSGKSQANEKEQEQYKQYRWQAGALRIVQDLSTAMTGHCASVITTSVVNQHRPNHTNSSVTQYHIAVSLKGNAETMLEQVKLASMHTMKWLQELDPLLMDAQVVPTTISHQYNDDDISTEGESMFREGQLYPRENLANRTYSGVVLYNTSERFRFPVLEQVVLDQWVETVTTYVKSLQWTLFLQSASPTELLSRYNSFLAKSSVVKTKSVSAISSQQVTSLLHGEARVAQQSSVLHTFLLHRHYLHRRFHLAAEHGGLYLLLKLMPLLSYTDKTAFMRKSKASAEEKQRQYLYAEWQARMVRLWHVSQLCDTLTLPAIKTPHETDNLFALLSTVAHFSSGISGETDGTKAAKSGYFAQEGTSVSRDVGRSVLTLHSELLWGDTILPLDDILEAMASNDLVTRYLSFADTVDDKKKTSEEKKSTKTKKSKNKKDPKRTQENEFSSQKTQLSQVPLRGNATVNMWEIKTLFADPVFCTNVYWYADALAGVPGIYDSPTFSVRVAQVLSLYRYCALHQPVSFLPTSETPSPISQVNTKDETTEKTTKGSERFTRYFTPKKGNNKNDNVAPTMVFHRIENAIAAQLNPLLTDSYDFSADEDTETHQWPTPIEELSQKVQRMSRMTRILPTSIIDELRKKFLQLSCRLRHTSDDAQCDNIVLPQ